MTDINSVYSVFTDGASRGNPGLAGAGFVIFDENGKEVAAKGIFLGEKTNNQAEYEALIEALTEASSIGIKRVKIFSDSQLLVRQMSGIYKIKNKNIIYFI